MADFTENIFVRELQELDFSRASIQTLSLWLKHHRKYHAVVVEIWFKELLKVQDTRQLIFMYLANAILQVCKKKSPEYGQEFGKVLGDSFRHIAKTGLNKKTKHSLLKILTKWQDKGVYDAQTIQQYKEAVDTAVLVPKQARKRKSTEVEVKGQPEKKAKVEAIPKQENSSKMNDVDGHVEAIVEAIPKQEYVSKIKEIDGHLGSSVEAVPKQRYTSETKEVDGHLGATVEAVPKQRYTSETKEVDGHLEATVEAISKQEYTSNTKEVDGHLEVIVEAIPKQEYASETKEVDGQLEAIVEAIPKRENTNETKEDDGHPQTHSTPSLMSRPRLSMNPEELIKALMELDQGRPSTSGGQSSSMFEEVAVEEQPYNNANVEAGARSCSETEGVDGHHETHATPGPTTSTARSARHDEIVKALLELEAWDQSTQNINTTLPLSIPGGDIFSKLEGKVTPYFRINYIINLVREIRKLSLLVKQLKQIQCQCTDLV